jgi:hypothetical protein
VQIGDMNLPLDRQRCMVLPFTEDCIVRPPIRLAVYSDERKCYIDIYWVTEAIIDGYNLKLSQINTNIDEKVSSYQN